MSSQGYVISVDPSRLASWIGCEDAGLKALIEGPTVEADEVLDTRWRDVIEPLMAMLPPREADMLSMRLRGSRQADIARVFGLSQAAVSYSLSRAIQRLRFLIEAPQVSADEIRVALAPHFNATDVAIVVTYCETTCQSETALRLSLTQGRVRHRLLLGLKLLTRLAQSEPSLEEVTKLLRMTFDQQNIKHAVVLPQWQKRQRESIETHTTIARASPAKATRCSVRRAQALP